jgi:hypothetical protein
MGRTLQPAPSNGARRRPILGARTERSMLIVPVTQRTVTSQMAERPSAPDYNVL